MEDRTAYEERFRRAGLPLLIEGRSAATDVWTRALPILVAVFWIELLGALNLNVSFWTNVATLAGGIGILAGAWVIANHLRGRKPWARPDDIGSWELGGFVVIPALLPLVLNSQPVSALTTAFTNLALLALLYSVIAYGLFSIVGWTARRLFAQLATSLTLFARAIPLLLLFSLVLFMTTEVWQVFGAMDDRTLATVIALFVAVGTLFLVVRLPREVRELEVQVGAGPPLDSRQRFNVGLVLFVSQMFQALLVALAVYLFYVFFGSLAISDAVTRLWVGHAPDYLLDTEVWSARAAITAEQLRVATAIAGFSGLYYSIAVLTDGTYREEFLSEMTDEMRETFDDRARYLALVRP
ncbi:MAG: hypothetical protein WAO61_04450 [Solirubrobacterales bacterium]